MKVTPQLKGQLINALEALVDEAMHENGFVRRKRSVEYTRASGDSEHVLDFVTDWFPSYQPGAEAHIHPMVRIGMPKVSEMALKMVGGNEALLACAADTLINEPIDFVAPKEAHVRWFASGTVEFHDVCSQIREFVFRWVFPFLAELQTPSDFLLLHETGDDRVVKQRHYLVFVAAAYQLEGRLEDAKDVIVRNFSGAGLRKRYQPVYESLGIT